MVFGRRLMLTFAECRQQGSGLARLASVEATDRIVHPGDLVAFDNTVGHREDDTELTFPFEDQSLGRQI